MLFYFPACPLTYFPYFLLACLPTSLFVTLSAYLIAFLPACLLIFVCLLPVWLPTSVYWKSNTLPNTGTHWVTLGSREELVCSILEIAMIRHRTHHQSGRMTQRSPSVLTRRFAHNWLTFKNRQTFSISAVFSAIKTGWRNQWPFNMAPHFLKYQIQIHQLAHFNLIHEFPF